MTQTVLVLGPTGRFGSNVALAFEKAGWSVRRFDRKRDTLETSARGVGVIVNGWHPAYPKWDKEVMAMQPQIQRAALANDATVIVPGNVYVFGPITKAPWSQHSPHHATNPLGKIRIAMEQSYRDAGVRTIVLRAGNFLDTHASGNCFDMIFAPSLKKGMLTYPGQQGIDQAWAYLPDLAKAAVLLAQMRDDLATFTDVPFPGYTFSAETLASTISKARGHDVRIKQMAWWPLRLAWPFMADIKYLFEMRYLWDTPHSLDSARFDELLPDFIPTPPVEAMRQATEFVDMPKGHNTNVTVAAA
jgi:nucleoside-diphosphate-sugar epimerase